MINLIPAKYR